MVEVVVVAFMSTLSYVNLILSYLNLSYPYHIISLPISTSQFCRALMVEVVVVAFVLVILLACYYTSAKTTIPVAQLTTSFSSLPLIQYTAATVTTSPYAYISQSLSAADTVIMDASKATSITWIYSLNFSIYLTGLFGWCGFWIFSFFCGAGLTSLPFDMIMVVFLFRFLFDF